jgi:hypothetical protein
MDIAIIHFQSEIESAIASRLSRIIRRYRDTPGPSLDHRCSVDQVIVRALKNDIVDPAGIDELSLEFEDASFVILLCTRRSKESVAFMRIAADMVSGGRGNSLVLVIVEGDPTESFPKNLVELLGGEEPLAANVVSGGKRGSLKRLSGSESLRIIAPIVGREYRELKMQFDKSEASKRRLAYAAIAVAAAASLGAYFFQSSSIARNIAIAKEYRLLNSHFIARIAASVERPDGSYSGDEKAIANILGSDDETLVILDQYREEAQKEHALVPYGIDKVEISSDLPQKLRLQSLLRKSAESEGKTFFSSAFREGIEEIGLQHYVLNVSKYLRDMENIAVEGGGSLAKDRISIAAPLRWIVSKVKKIKLAKLLRHL